MTSPAAFLARARRVVIKVGSALVVDEKAARADSAWLAALAGDVQALRARGCEVLIVSSGSIALGRRRLGLNRKALSLEEKQAAASAGQSLLMRAWEEALDPHGIVTAQVLLTRDDTETRRRGAAAYPPWRGRSASGAWSRCRRGSATPGR